MQRSRVRPSITATEYLTHPAGRARSELVHGDVRMMTPASGAHGLVSGNVFRLLSVHVNERRLGHCFADSTGFELPGVPDTVRAPDASFVRADRLPPAGVGGGWLTLAPDLAVEVLSPTETASDLEKKLSDYATAGVRMVWVIDPDKRRVSVVGRGIPARWIGDRDTLDGGEVVPGFACPVWRLFEGLAPTPSQ